MRPARQRHQQQWAPHGKDRNRGNCLGNSLNSQPRGGYTAAAGDKTCRRRHNFLHRGWKVMPARLVHRLSIESSFSFSSFVFHAQEWIVTVAKFFKTLAAGLCRGRSESVGWWGRLANHHHLDYHDTYTTSHRRSFFLLGLSLPDWSFGGHHDISHLDTCGQHLATHANGRGCIHTLQTYILPHPTTNISVVAGAKILVYPACNFSKVSWVLSAL